MRSFVLCFVLCFSSMASADDWPPWRCPDRDGTWKETGLTRSLPSPRMPLVWQAEIGNGYSGPTVANGRVYVSDRLTEPEEVERVLCFDAATGDPLWTHSYPCEYRQVGYPDGPRAAVTIDGGRAYHLGTLGHLYCLDAASGEVLWKKVPGTDYDVDVPGWGIASAPLVYGDLLIVQLGVRAGGCLVALDKVTGAERWRALDDKASYSAPIIIQHARQDVLICYTGERLAGLDPKTGKVHYAYPTPPHRMVINISTPVLDEKGRLFVTCFYDGSYLFQLAEDELAIELVWHRRGDNEKRTDAMHGMISNPWLDGEYIYGVDSYGQLRCLDIATGDRVWEDLTAVPEARWATIHTVRNGDDYWMFNERGELLLARVDPEGFHEMSRSKLIDPTEGQLGDRGGVCWAHPAYANKHVYARNDGLLVCASLAAE